MGVIRAEGNAKTSTISARRITLDTYNGAQPCIFDVAEGAVLEVDAEIIDNTRGGRASPSGFVKRGKGRLVLKRPSPMTGTVSVEEGTLALAEGASLSKLALLEVYTDAKLELAAGVPPISAPRINVPAAVRKATVRVDATRYWGNGYGDAWDYNGLFNLGTSGGSFTRNWGDNPLTFTTGVFRGSEWPAFRMNWVDYTLTGFSNPSRSLTMLYSLRHATTDSRESWRGVYSVYNGAAKTANPSLEWNADNAVATFRLEMPSPNTAATGYNARYVQYRGSWSATELTNYQNRPYDEAYVDCVVLSNLTASSQKFVWEQHFTNTIQRKESNLGYSGALNHDTFRLGCRPNDGAACSYQSFGELMMFCGDVLTPQELADVKTYLKTKWLGTHVPNAGDGTESVTELNVSAGTVDVAQGASKRAVKRGAGTLEVTSVKETAADLSVEAGTLAFVSKGSAPKALVWADFGDGSSLTTNASGHVLSFKNKGALGGTFKQTSQTASNYGYLSPSGNNRPYSVMRCRWSTYDFLDDRIRPSDKDTLTAIVVFKPQSSAQWNDMFALLPSEEVMRDTSKAFTPRFYFEAASPFFAVYRNDSDVDIANTQVYAKNYYANVGSLVGKFAILGVEMPPERQVTYFADAEPDGGVDSLALKSTATDCSRRFGGVRLGGRPNSRVTGASWWDGDIAETMVFKASLTDAERTAIMSYLRTKWYDGKTVTAPAVLAGTPAPARTSGGALTLADGVTVKIDGEAVRVDSLTVPSGAVVTIDPGTLDKDADDGRVLIEFAGGTVAGSFVLPPRLRAHWDVKVDDGVVSLVHYRGTTILVR